MVAANRVKRLRYSPRNLRHSRRICSNVYNRNICNVIGSSRRSRQAVDVIDEGYMVAIGHQQPAVLDVVNCGCCQRLIFNV